MNVAELMVIPDPDTNACPIVDPEFHRFAGDWPKLSSNIRSALAWVQTITNSNDIKKIILFIVLSPSPLVFDFKIRNQTVLNFFFSF